MDVYVNFSDGAKSEIVETFSCPQSPEDYPNQGVVDIESAQYKEFMNAFNQP